MKKKKVPKFKSEAEAARFWSKHSPLDYMDEFTPVEEPFEFDPKLLKEAAEEPREKKSTLTIRIQPSLVFLAKIIAKRHGSAYQSLIRMWINEKIHDELKTHPGILKKLRKRKLAHK